MTAHLTKLVQHLRRLSARSCEEPAADAVLLERFVRSRDNAAFSALVTRHGPMVLRLCRRVLGDPHAAEDAFQAAFFVLAQKAGAIRKADSLAAWLHGVAYRIAMKARTADARRNRSLQSLTTEPADTRADPFAELSARELLTLLDEELQRLPEVYRLPIILCCLQGRTQEEAARQLGWTPGSLQGRLERGRAKLHARLARRGVSFAAAMLVLESVQGTASAALPPAGFVTALLEAARLSPSTLTPRVLALAQETMRGMAVAKIKIGIVLVLTISAVAAGTGMLVPQVQKEGQPPAQANAASPRVQQASVSAKQAPRTDRYGDPLPPGAIARLGTIRLRRGNRVYALPERDAFLSVLQQFESIQVCKWRMSTGELLHDAEYRLNRGSAETVVSSDDKILAACGFDDKRDSVIRLWDLASGKVVGEIKTPDYHAQVLAFSPDGRMIAVAAGDQTLRLWDRESQTELRRFKGTDNNWESLTFSPDGKILASTSRSRRTVRLWDAATLRDLRALDDGPGPAPDHIVFSPDSKTVATTASGEKNKTVRLWETATGKEVRQFHSRFQTGALAFSPDGKILAAGSMVEIGKISKDIEELRPIHLWDVSSGREVRRLPGHIIWISSLVFSTNGKRLVSAGGGFAMKVWDVATGKEVVPLEEHEGWISAAAFSPDGRYLASSSVDGSIRLWEAATGKPVRIFEGGAGPRVLHIAFAPDSRTLISDRPDGSLRLWDVATGRQIRRLRVGEEGYPCIFAYAPDGRTLAVRNKDGTVGLLDAASGAVKRRLTGGMKSGNVLGFSPDGKKLASMSYVPRGSGATLQVWDVATGEEKLKRTFPFDTPLAFSTDGKTLFGILPDTRPRSVNPSFSLSLWDMTGDPDRTFKIPQRRLAESLARSPDGRMLAWDDHEGTITLWDLAANQVRRRFKEHSTRILSLAFSPNGKTLASGSADTTVLLWDVTGKPTTGHSVALSRDRLASLWDELASKDAAKAFDVIGLLTAAPEQAVPLLRAKLKPAPTRADPKQVTRIINDLESERFEIRRKAMEELRGLGEYAEPALQAALAKKPSLEARKRIDELLEGVRELTAMPDGLRESRAVEVLEHIATPGARQVLQTLAAGAPAARLTREAKASLERLEVRHAPFR